MRFLGFQDTLYADSKLCHTPAADGGTCHAARQYYSDCYIEGHVDFIFGDAKAVFDRCEIHTMAAHHGYHHRAEPPAARGGLRLCLPRLHRHRRRGSEDILLGRPWRAYSTVVFLNTDFKAPLDPAGWKEWNGALATSDYAEFNSHGMAGEVSKRIAPSKQLTAPTSASTRPRTWLAGTDGWDPEKVR